MAISDIAGGGFHLPPPYPGVIPPATTNKLAFSTADAKGALVFQVPRTGNVESVVWRTGNVVTGATIDMRLETVDLATGDPTGTLVGTTTNVSVVVASVDDNVVFSSTLTAAATVTRGDVVALVFVNPSASFANMQVAGMNWSGNSEVLPYHTHFTGSWTKGTATLPAVAFLYDDGVYAVPPGCFVPPIGVTTSAFNTGSTPDVYALRFQLPVSVRVSGAWVAGDLDGDCQVALVSTAYNQGAGTGILASVTLDSSVRGSVNSGLSFLAFPSPVTLTAATYYRLIVEPSSATSVTVYDASTGALALLDAFPCGSLFHLSTAKDPTGDGSWTNYNSGTFRVPYMGILVDGIDSGSGSGAGSYPVLG